MRSRNPGRTLADVIGAMRFNLATSHPGYALLGGAALAACILGFLWAIDLPLDWRVCILGMAVGTIASAIYFYDGSGRSTQPIKRSEVIMRNVLWGFSGPVMDSDEQFIAKVSQQQPAGSGWRPDERLPDRGPVEIEIVTYHDDDPCRTITLLPPANSEWTHGLLLHALHNELAAGRAPFADSIFFEGLVRSGAGRYQVLLGS